MPGFNEGGFNEGGLTVTGTLAAAIAEIPPEPPAIILAIADAVVAVLSAAVLSLPFTIDRSYVFVRELAPNAGLRVSVMPTGLEIRAFDLRPRHEYNPHVEIWVHARARPTPEECDPLMDLVEEIAALFLPGTRLSGTRAVIIGVECKPLYSPDRLDEQRIFAAGITITFRLTR